MSAEHTTSRTINAYVLVRTEAGTAPTVAERIKDMLQRADVMLVEGSYDILVSVEADAEEYVTTAVRNHIRTANGVVQADVLFAIAPDLPVAIREQEVHTVS